MDRFDLNWPNADAEFYTDGWRCRIVWRQKGKRNGGGIGGTIDNNTQCVRRVAESLEGAPYLLSALKARGHERLAGQIESVVEVAGDEQPRQAPTTAVRKPVRSERRETGSAQPQVAKAADRQRRQDPAVQSAPKSERPMASERAAPRRVERVQKAAVSPEMIWLQALAGSDTFEAASSRRAKAWIELGSIGDGVNEPVEALFLKIPAAKGKQEWVLKRTWPSEPKRKAEYVAAEHFRGIANYLVGAGTRSVDIERLFSATGEVVHEELAQAATAWRGSASGSVGAH